MAKIDDIINSFPFVFKFGRGTVGTTFTTVWGNGTIFDGFMDDVAPGTEEFVNVVSDNAADDSVPGVPPIGDGLRTVQIIGQNAAGYQISELLSLRGLTPVQTQNKYAIIYTVVGLTAGNSLYLGATSKNVGKITLTSAVSARIMSVITPNKGRTLQSFYRMPMDKYGKLCKVNIYPTGNKFIQIEFYARFPLDILSNSITRTQLSSWQIIGSADFSNGSVMEKDFCLPQLIYPGSDLIFVAKTDVGTAELSVDFEIELKDFEI